MKNLLNEEHTELKIQNHSSFSFFFFFSTLANNISLLNDRVCLKVPPEVIVDEAKLKKTQFQPKNELRLHKQMSILSEAMKQLID